MIKETKTTDSSNPNQNKKSSDWLKILETQSWQAELIISGLIVTGLLKFPNWVKNFGQKYLLNSTESSYLFFDFILMMLLTATFILIIFFVAHFVMRTIWVALLGLNSVYPQGINPDSKNGLGPKYWKKAKEEFPDLSSYNQELDDKCSLMFSMACNLVITIISIGVLVFSFYLFYRLLIAIFPNLRDYSAHIGIGLYILFAILAFSVQHIAKKYPDNLKVQKFMESYGKIMGGLFSLYIFKKPNSYISGTIVSNAKPNKLAVLGMMLFGGVMGFNAAAQTKDNPIYRSFSGPRYMIFNNRTEKFFNFNYENLRNPETLPFTPFIQSDVILDDFIKLYIPTIEREKEHMGVKSLNILQRLKMKRIERNEYYRKQLPSYLKFNQITLNEKAIDITDAMYYEYDSRVEEGILIYLSTAHCKEGKNILEIKKNYFLKETQKIVKIPFYCKGN